MLVLVTNKTNRSILYLISVLLIIAKDFTPFTREYYGGFISDRENIDWEKYGGFSENPPHFIGHVFPAIFPS